MHPSTLADAAVHPAFPASRRIIICDIENVIGGSAAPASAVRGCLTHLEHALGRSLEDVLVIGAGPTMTATLALVGVRSVVFGRGVSGADRALAQVLNPAAMVGRFASVQLVSGDREFAPAVAALASAGLPTDVWARPGSVSMSLAKVARSVSLALSTGHSNDRCELL